MCVWGVSSTEPRLASNSPASASGEYRPLFTPPDVLLRLPECVSTLILFLGLTAVFLSILRHNQVFFMFLRVHISLTLSKET